MLIDIHIHVGKFNKLYFSPIDIIKLMKEVGVDYYAVSSTSICREDYEEATKEIHELVLNDEEHVLPVMWITPEGLQGNIAWYLESGIKWRILKIHPFLNQMEWNPNGDLFAEVIEISRELCLPLLIHTGNENCCQCGNYEPLIESYPDIKFILAHGRPLAQAVPILAKYPNAYADSAFMPVEDMRTFITKGLSQKLLWGTDMCIPKYFYPQKNMLEYYQQKLSAFRKVSTIEQFEQVTYKNAKTLFSL